MEILEHHSFRVIRDAELEIDDEGAEDLLRALEKQLARRRPIVDALIEAAESGKQVLVLVEITARFDELANISWARKLEQAGCHVVYGIVGLKTHCKLCMVIRREGDELRRYVHVGTGNYNPATARIYEDLGLLTADEAIGTDVGDLFNYLTGYSHHKNYRSLIVAPYEMRDRLVTLIDREASLSRDSNAGSRIIMKLNHLVDEDVIDALYRASAAGVQIDLLVRGMCSIRPGVPGRSDNIRVRSVLGRYLEHSRVYCFGSGETGQIYIGSYAPQS